MTGQNKPGRVIVAPMFDQRHADLVVPERTTIAEIVAAALPGLPECERAHVRVAVSAGGRISVVPQTQWRFTRPLAGTSVIIRVIPANSSVRPILTLVATVAATALAGPLGGIMAGSLGISAAVGTAIAGIGIGIVSNVLLNTLVPPPKTRGPQTPGDRYSIQGWRNRLDPGAPEPLVLGSLRYAPPFGATSYVSVSGNDQRVRAIFTFGPGPMKIEDIQLGETALDKYNDYDLEVREGLPDDDPLRWYTIQCVEEPLGLELDYNEPVIRVTGSAASAARVIFGFPQGVIRYTKKGKERENDARIKIEYRQLGAEDWITDKNLKVREKTTTPFFREHIVTFPVRGRYEVRITKSDQKHDRRVEQVQWLALQTIRPEYPLNSNYPLGLICLRIRASKQLNGQLDDVSAKVSVICPDYDAATGSWVTRQTSNPASLFRYILQCPANPKPVPDSEIDLDQLAEWHAFCTARGLRYDAVHDQPGETLSDALIAIAAAGRASPRHDGMLWGVTIDNPRDMIVMDELSPRNSWGFQATRQYAEPPDGFRVQFLDATNDHKPAERLVPWPGHSGDIDLTELIDLPGKTDPAEIYREAVRHMLVAIHRPDTYQVMQDGHLRQAVRGDLVALSHDVLDARQRAARIKDVVGSMVLLDELVTIESEQSYALQYRHFEGGGDTVGVSVVRPVSAAPGETNIITLDGTGPMPSVRDHVMFGPASQVTCQMIVTGIETGQDSTVIIHMIDAAPQIDDTLDATPIPAWSGLYGVDIDDPNNVPVVPDLRDVSSGVNDAGTIVLTYLITPGIGGATISDYEIEHRLSGTTVWSVAAISAADGGGAITGYQTGDQVEVRARAFAGATAGEYTDVVEHTIDALVPRQIPLANISVQPRPGGAWVYLTTTDDSATAQVQLWISDTGQFVDAIEIGNPVDVEASRLYDIPAGDVTRENLLQSGNFDSPSAWSVGDGWSIAGGEAAHISGLAGSISQAFEPTAAAHHISVDVVEINAGEITVVWLTITGNVTITTITTSGLLSVLSTPPSGATGFALHASADFDGRVTSTTIYEHTATALQSGIHYLWVEPINDDETTGLMTGPVQFITT